MPFAAIWMNREIIILSEVSQKEKDKYTLLTDRESKLVIISGERRGEGPHRGR